MFVSEVLPNTVKIPANAVTVTRPTLVPTARNRFTLIPVRFAPLPYKVVAEMIPVLPSIVTPEPTVILFVDPSSVIEEEPTVKIPVTLALPST